MNKLLTKINFKVELYIIIIKILKIKHVFYFNVAL